MGREQRHYNLGMDFTLSDAQRAWQETGRALAREWPSGALAAAVAASAQAAGVFAADVDAASAVALIEATGIEHPVGAVTLALQMATSVSLADAVPLLPSTGRAVALSSEVMPSLDGDRLNGHATWVGPMAGETAFIVGAAHGDDVVACAVAAAAAGVA